MRCTLDGNNTRSLAKAVQSLSKIGTELFIEADQQGLQLRSINAIHSAVGSIRFSRMFFETFQVKPGNENYCKVTMKACLGVFRNMKQVEHCELRILPEDCKFEILLKCKSEVVKNARISLIDEQNINAAVSVADATNMISGYYKLFGEILSNFTTAEEELTLEFKENSLIAQNFVEGSRVLDKFMRSQFKLCSTEFDTYNIEHDTSVTFCLREFRAFLLFAEALNENLVLKFNDAGSPCFVEVKKLDYIDCLLILSTLSPDDVSFSDDYRERDLIVHNDDNVNTANKERVATKRKSSNETNHRRAFRDSKLRMANDTTLSNTSDSALFNFNDDRSRREPTTHTNRQSVQAPRMLVTDTTKVGSNVVDIVNVADDDDDGTPVVVRQGTIQTESGPQVTFYSTPALDDNNDDCVPQSPERETRVRTIFTRCFQSTFVPREPSPNSELFVANSDTED